MGNASDSMQTYLTRLRDETGLSWAELSAATQLPDSTIRKIFSGNTLDPRLETISQIVFAMNGSLDDMLKGSRTDTHKQEAPADAKKAEEAEKLRALGTEYMQKSYEKRLDEKEASMQQYIASLKRDKMFLFTLACILTTILIVFFFADLLLGSAGWIRY